jgi:Glu-tRNA(Gln) amidotransferase subunit E-like FAD-binding protein
MKTNQILILIAEKHNTWVEIVNSFGCNKETSEDIVQEMYIKIHKYLEKGNKNIMYDDEVNYYYIFKTLNSIFIDLKRKGKNIKKVEIENLEINHTDINYIESYDKIQECLSEMYWYNRVVFEIINSGESISELSRKSFIPYYSLYNTYHKVKSKLKKIM